VQAKAERANGTSKRDTPKGRGWGGKGITREGDEVGIYFKVNVLSSWEPKRNERPRNWVLSDQQKLPSGTKSETGDDLHRVKGKPRLLRAFFSLGRKRGALEEGEQTGLQKGTAENRDGCGGRQGGDDRTKK